MYNIYATSSGKDNHGSFKLDYVDPPIIFQRGTKLALLNLMTWNNIYNISAARKNNIFWVRKITGSGTTNGYEAIDSNHDTDSKKISLSGGGHLLRIVLPDGQYSIEALDKEIAIRIGDDLESGSEVLLKEDSLRAFRLEANDTYNKVDFHYSSTDYDIVFPKNDTEAPVKNSILNFLGLQDIAVASNETTLTHNSTGGAGSETGHGVWSGGSRVYYSLNAAVSGTNSRIAPSIADVNNGLTNLNLRLRNGIINGGKESSHGGESDILYSFNITSSPGYPQNDAPPNLTWLEVKAVETPITELFFEYTDQNGTPLGTNMADESSFTIVVQPPEEDLGAAIATLTEVINNISMGNK
tara:strand:+ start:233 stop:1297 length:1065 start_codon:yes stop_codon:yes gene_type:complete